MRRSTSHLLSFTLRIAYTPVIVCICPLSLCLPDWLYTLLLELFMYVYEEFYSSTRLTRLSSACRRYVEVDSPSVKKLYITKIVREDAGNYVCSATIKGRQHRKTVNLLIFSESLPRCFFHCSYCCRMWWGMKIISFVIYSFIFSKALRWRPGVVVSAMASISEVNQRRARLVLRWVTVSGFSSRCRTFISVFGQPRRSTRPGHPFVGRCNEYQPKYHACLYSPALRLESKGRHGSCVGGRWNCVISSLHTALIWAP